MSMNVTEIINRPQRYTVELPEKKSKIKVCAGISSAVGTGIALALISKRQGFSLNPKTILKTNPADWAIFAIANKNHPNRKLLNIEEKEILTLATGSVLGGLAGGAIFDRKNMKAKFRESLTQIFGNVVMPVAFVGGMSRIYKKYEKQITDFMPQIKKDGLFIKHVNKFLKIFPAVGLTLASLAMGIYSGSKITNYINGKFFGQKEKRNIKTSDFAPHVDDLCLAVTLMGAKDSVIASSITRTLPFFLAIPGYQVAKAQDKA